VFHKGFPVQYPLLGPGVYLKSDTNTMRIYMNAVDDWNKYCEVENFPVQKWVAVAIVMRELLTTDTPFDRSVVRSNITLPVTGSAIAPALVCVLLSWNAP
jgi:hypothetical protein